jgi:hypothetical protein
VGRLPLPNYLNYESRIMNQELGEAQALRRSLTSQINKCGGAVKLQ